MRAAAAVLVLLALSSSGLAQDVTSGVAKSGAMVFNKCSGCHAVGPGAKHKVGPHLNRVIGRVAGSLLDYDYSPAMKQAGRNGLAWTAETLWAFLSNPREVVPGTKMSFPGLKDPTELADLIAFLATQNAAK